MKLNTVYGRPVYTCYFYFIYEVNEEKIALSINIFTNQIVEIDIDLSYKDYFEVIDKDKIDKVKEILIDYFCNKIDYYMDLAKEYLQLKDNLDE